MNDEQGFEPPQTTPKESRPSRWAVQPGSVSDSMTFRRPEGLDKPAESQRRPASEIIREVRQQPGGVDEATHVGDGVPPVPRSATTRTGGSSTTTREQERSTTETGAAQPARVTADLGENQELRAATGGSSSSLIMAGFGGVMLVALGGLIGATLDYLFSDRLGVATAIGLTLGAALAALITRKRDLVSVIVAPPIVYAVVAALVLLISSRPVKVTSIADVAIRGFPTMALATGVAAIIAGIRLLTSRAGERR